MFDMASVEIIFMCLLLSFQIINAQSNNFVTVACQNQNVVAQYGTSTLLECVVEPHEKDTILEIVTWTRNDVAVLTYDGENILCDDPSVQFAKSSTWSNTNMNVSLLIPNTKLSHTGEYHCYVMTDRGEGKSPNVQLTVKSNYSKPMIESDTEKITRDKDFTLTCKAHDGFPQGSIRWLVNDEAWKKNPNVEVQKNPKGLFDLTSVLYVGPNTPFTKFVCEVYNAAGVKEGQQTFDYQPMDTITGSGTKGHSVAHVVAPLMVIGSLIVGLLSALLICRRRRQHIAPPPAYDEEDIPPPPAYDEEEGGVAVPSAPYLPTALPQPPAYPEEDYKMDPLLA